MSNTLHATLADAETHGSRRKCWRVVHAFKLGHLRHHELGGNIPCQDLLTPQTTSASAFAPLGGFCRGWLTIADSTWLLGLYKDHMCFKWCGMVKLTAMHCNSTVSRNNQMLHASMDTFLRRSPSHHTSEARLHMMDCRYHGYRQCIQLTIQFEFRVRLKILKNRLNIEIQHQFQFKLPSTNF